MHLRLHDFTFDNIYSRFYTVYKYRQYQQSVYKACCFMCHRKERRDMANRVTIQDIADALGLSRNTVSKAIKNRGILAVSTRERILKKAVEMGYKQFSYVNVNSDPALGTAVTLKNEIRQNASLYGSQEEAGVIALLTGGPVNNSHFASTMLDRFQRELTEMPRATIRRGIMRIRTSQKVLKLRNGMEIMIQ